MIIIHKDIGSTDEDMQIKKGPKFEKVNLSVTKVPPDNIIIHKGRKLTYNWESNKREIESP